MQGANRKVVIVGNYRFTGKLLGKGNFARVEEAVHNVLNEKVAIKIMDVNQINEDYVIRNLYREAKLMAKLKHPCIAALYQTMQRSDNVYYLVTEMASGGDLCAFIKNQRSGKLEERPTRIYARQFVSALGHMHHVGVVHRDLKMENVMLNAAQTQIKIVDFGLSNVYSPDEPLRTHCGSPEYAAPELFITGKKYGPEVDLWSLGIILYGMVMGELPFVSNRRDQMTSQERRKKLIAQINKGLSTSHRRSLSIFSIEFRNMINRMLVADASKRISIKELLNHPWITEKGAKLVRVNPIKKLELKQQAAIIAEICDLTHQSSHDVISIINQEPYGKIGGIFNVMSHKYCLSRLSGDGITKIPPTLEVEPGSEKKSPTKRPYNLRSSVSSRATQRPADVAKSSGGDLYTPRVSVHQRIPTAPQNATRPSTEMKRPTTPGVSLRPRTVLPQLNEKKVNYKEVKTPFMSRKAYSAGITPKTNRPSTVCSPFGINKVPRPADGKEVTNRRFYSSATRNAEDPAKQELSPYLNRLKMGLGVAQSERQQTSIDKKQRSKSEKLPVSVPSRPATSTRPNSSFRKAFGLSMTQSDSKAANKPALKETNKAYSRLQKVPRPSTCTGAQPMEKSSLAYGDIANQKLKKPTLYDPIARSIADYVCNNVPDKLPNLSHFRK